VKIGESDGPIYGSVGVLDVDKVGYYSLDVEVLSDAGCLNASHPRLRVWNRSDFPYDDLNQTAIWTIPITVAAGLGLLVYAASLARTSRTTKRYAIFEVDDTRVTTGRPLRRPPIPTLISGLPSFGLFCGTILSFVAIALMVDYANRPLPKGIRVFIRSAHPEMPGAVVTEQPIVVRIEYAGPNSPYRLYVSSKLVAREEFESALRDELKRRPDWVVNVEADPNLPWMAVADAIDGIKGVHAKTVLLTPETSIWMRKRYTENAERISAIAVRRRH
jgi:biopolymer transport protein ExbD